MLTCSKNMEITRVNLVEMNQEMNQLSVVQTFTYGEMRMSNELKLEEIKNKMIEYAKRKTWNEVNDFNPYSGVTNVSYYGGWEDGKTDLAREVIKIINK